MKVGLKSGIGLVSILLAALVLTPACHTNKTVTATATITTTPPGGTITQPSPTGTYTSNGQRIFLTGTSASGSPIYAQGYMMIGRYLVCADCHGTQGKGGTVTMMMFSFDAPNITWMALTDPKQFNPPYTEETLKRAFTQGIGSDGATLIGYMPRWSMSAQDQNNLVSFIKTLK